MPTDASVDHTWDPEILETSVDGDTGSHAPLSSHMLRSTAPSIVSVLASIPNITDMTEGATDPSGSLAEACGGNRSGSMPFSHAPPFGDARRTPVFRGAQVWAGEPLRRVPSRAGSDGHSEPLAHRDRAPAAPPEIMATLSLPGLTSRGTPVTQRSSTSALITPRPGPSMPSMPSTDADGVGSVGEDWAPSVPLTLTQGIYSPPESDASSSLDYELRGSPSPSSTAHSSTARGLFEVCPRHCRGAGLSLDVLSRSTSMLLYSPFATALCLHSCTFFMFCYCSSLRRRRFIRHSIF